MTLNRSPDPQELLEHDVWIRRLCTRLVGDPSRGEDLVQETYAAALSARRPRAREAVRAWLAGIARNRWRDAQRTNARRLWREESSARAEAIPSSDQLVEEVELRRVVAEAMSRLEEPLQRALVLRFFHDCTLDVLARREGISVSTAHARVERGIERLRRALDRSNVRGREAWLGVALSTARREALQTTEMFAMGSTVKTLLACAAVAFVLFVTWRGFWIPGRADDAIGLAVAPDFAEETTSGPALDDHGSVDLAERTSAAPPVPGLRALDVRLLRDPDDAPLAHLAFEVPDGVLAPGTLWPSSDVEGRARVTVPASLTELSLIAGGYQPGTASIPPGSVEIDVRLRPTSGVFGRVLVPDGAPAASVSVSLATLERSLYYPKSITRSRTRVEIQGRWRQVAVATSNALGWFYVPIEPGTSLGPARLRTSLGDLGRSLDIVLARQAVDVGQIVLADPPRLELRVRDVQGVPIAGAEIGSWWSGPLGVTDPSGRLVLADPLLPTNYFVRAVGYRTREVQIDGEVARGQWQITSAHSRVEFVLDVAPVGRVRVLDAVTGLPLFLATGRVELLRGATAIGASTFQLERDGHGTVRLDDEGGEGHIQVADRVRIVVDKEGYRQDQTFELEISDLQRVEPAELELEPTANFRCLRGRVMRGGVPVGHVQVGLKASNLVDEMSGGGYQYFRAFTDAEGRFSLRWRDAPGSAITVHPHWVRWDEFGFIGPMSQEDAEAQEHVLELLPAQRVPVVLRGAESNFGHCYYVEVKGEVAGTEGYVSTTINGAPLELHGDGEVRTTILLPAERAVRVRIDTLVTGAILRSGAAPVEHDPSAPSLPLVFELAPQVLRVSGRVAGLAEKEWPRLAVATESEFSSEALLVPVAADGTFAFEQLSAVCDVYLVRLAENGSGAEVLAHRTFERGVDTQGVVLYPDSDSLRERPEGRR